MATAYTLVLHAALWLPITLLGFFYMIREGLRWSDLTQASQLRESESDRGMNIAIIGAGAGRPVGRL